jgi:hypothetical protein
VSTFSPGSAHRLLGALTLAGFVFAVVPLADAAPRRTLKYGIPEDRLEVFEFDLSRFTTTEMVHLPAEAEQFDVESLTARIDEVTVQLEGRLERVLARVFRDFSLGLVTRLVDLRGTVSRGGESHPLDVDVLEGKSVSFRLLPSGELLDATGWSRLAGAGRGGSLVEELLLQTVMRLPQHVLRRDQTESASFRLRVPLDPFLKRDQTWVVRFEAAPPPEGCGRRCVAFTYRGEIGETAVDTHPGRPMRLVGKATVSGTIVLGRGRALREHSFVFDWDRTLRSERANGTLRGEIHQTERVEGSIRVVEAS